MLRSLVCAAAIFFLLASICLIPQNALARRCPVKMPETLLSLYQNSDSIYIAAFDRIEEGKVTEETEDYTAIGRKKHFVVSSVLKGEAQKFFVLEDIEYRYKDKPQEPETGGETAEMEQSEPAGDPGEAEPTAEDTTETETIESGDAEEVEFVGVEAQLRAGDTVLLFVRKGREDESPRLTDYRDGLKKMSGEQLAAYEKRINELNGIFAEKKVSNERILEWLIRAAEDPLTRWEGTYELLSAAQQLEWRQQAAERRRERIANGLPVEEEAVEPAEGEDVSPGAIGHKNIDTTVFAKIIDPNQKMLLANILLDRAASTNPDKSKKQGSVRGDRELIELIKRWGDPRLLGYLLDSLRGGGGEPYEKADAMDTIAELLDDEEAGAIADKYQESAWENDSDAVGEENEEVAADEDEAQTEVETPPADPSTPAEPENKPAPGPEAEAPEIADAPAPKKQTYRELRDELLQKFLVRCDKVIADREKEKIAENAR